MSPWFSQDIGVDLGTEKTRIAVPERVLLEEATLAVLAFEDDVPRIVASGEEAETMLGRVPEGLEVVRPLHHGVIAYYEITEALLRYLVRKSRVGSWLFRPRAMITVPHGVTSVEQRAVYEAMLRAGAREVYLIQAPLAAAIGADLPIGTPAGNMIVCMGAGATQAAVIAMYGIVSAETLRKGGQDINEAIIAYVRKKYGVILGSTTAEEVKRTIGAAVPLEEELSIEVQGQHQVTGLPKPVTLVTSEIVEAIYDVLQEMVATVQKVIEQSPPELVSDIIDRGVALCGGTALLRGMDRLMTKELGVPAYLVDQPLHCTVLGAARAVALYPRLRRHLPRLM